jgi:hypothetical protein
VRVRVHVCRLGFHVTGFGCMTCVGNSGELLDNATAAATGKTAASGSRAEAATLPPPVLAAVLSGNRNFESRVHPLVSAGDAVVLGVLFSEWRPTQGVRPTCSCCGRHSSPDVTSFPVISDSPAPSNRPVQV